MTKTFASYSFGCRVNMAEKEMLDRELSVLGYQWSANNPDIFIINTCAVTQKAEREARQLIYQTKRKYPKTKIVVTGCAATKWINEKTIWDKNIWFIENNNKEYIAQLINSKGKRQKLISCHSDLVPILSGRMEESTKYSKIILVGRFLDPDCIGARDDKFINSKRMMLKIQDGCQRFCTYCIVPYLRGQPKSERIQNLVLRIKNEEKNIKEVILTAINTEAFGYDTDESLADLIESILENTKIERLSMGSVHPWSIDDEFIKLYRKNKENDRLVKFLHVPLQSGSNKILSLMKRGYTREEFMEKLNRLNKINPYTFIGTDIIAGFLEESAKDFEDTYNFLAGSPISKFHVFRYSKREKTAAFFMAKNMKEPAPKEKAKRAKVLIELSEKKYQKFLKKHIGKTFPALFLERIIDGYQEALLNNQIPVFIKTGKNMTGEINQVKIERLNQDKLFGKIL